MPKPYFQYKPWPDFHYNGTIYKLDHLAEHEIEVTDSSSVKRTIVITYSDHCFTDKPESEADPALVYPDCSRGAQGHFSFERYHCSLDLPTFVSQLTNNKVWNVNGGNYAQLPIITHNGQRTWYAIIFSLDPVKGLPIDLHLKVRTAYPNSRDHIPTFGHVSFSRLVKLRVENKTPPPVYDKHRKKPQRP